MTVNVIARYSLSHVFLLYHISLTTSVCFPWWFWSFISWSQ